jgi:hypothetical protein
MVAATFTRVQARMLRRRRTADITMVGTADITMVGIIIMGT